MAIPARTYITPDEYLRSEELSEEKHAYFQGQVYAMAGGSEGHNLICGNILTALNIALRGQGCRVYPSDMRLQVQANGLYTYPDVSVVCGTPQLAPGRTDTLLNPLLIVEVLSPTTEKYDRGQKFELYRALPDLRGYLLVDQGRVYAEYYERTADNKWLMTTTADTNALLALPAFGITLPVADFYLNSGL